MFDENFLWVLNLDVKSPNFNMFVMNFNAIFKDWLRKLLYQDQSNFCETYSQIYENFKHL